MTVAPVAAFTGAGDYVSPTAFSDGFVAAISVSAILSLIGVIAALAVGGRKREPLGAGIGAAQAQVSASS